MGEGGIGLDAGQAVERALVGADDHRDGGQQPLGLPQLGLRSVVLAVGILVGGEGDRGAQHVHGVGVGGLPRDALDRRKHALAQPGTHLGELLAERSELT